MTDSVNPRELALSVLLAVTRDGAYSNVALCGTLEKYRYLEKRERAFVTRLTEGTLERMIELDYIIDRFSTVKTARMKPVIRCILRSAVYEIKYMDAVPQAAACNEAVKLARKKGFSNLAGFVNGVLRNIARNLDHIEYPDVEKEPFKSLSVRYSMPEWIVLMWSEAYGAEQTRRALAALMGEAPLTVRTNLTKNTPEELKEILEKEGLKVTASTQLPYAFTVEGADFLQSLESFRQGRFYVQDISSMQVVETAEPKAGDYVLDVCAAPGGKSLQIAERLNQTGCVKAWDLSERKVGLIRENIMRCGITNIQAVCHDATIYEETEAERADIVIADLPCSGLGVLRRKKDIRYRVTQEQLTELVLLQRAILNVVHRYVKPGGSLVYSTCTIHKRENEENVEWFQKEHPQFELVSMRQIWPSPGGGDGFFIAKLRKKDEWENGHQVFG